MFNVFDELGFAQFESDFPSREVAQEMAHSVYEITDAELEDIQLYVGTHDDAQRGECVFVPRA